MSAQTRKLGYYLFIGALAVLFALQWGPGSQGCDSGRIHDTQSAATVNGQPIPLREFAKLYLQQVAKLRRQGVSAEMLMQYGVHDQLIDQLVNTELLAQAAEIHGVTATNDDLLKVLREAPAFQKNGRFDKDMYVQFIREYERTSTAQFENKLRRQLAAQRLLELVKAGAIVSDEEVKAKYLRENDSASATFVRFEPTMFIEQMEPPKPDVLETWAKENEKAVEDNYEANKPTYLVPEQVKARQIILHFQEGATDEEKAQVETRIAAIRKEIVEDKKPFAEVAKLVSEDTATKEVGGDLGFVNRFKLPTAFADLLFALKPGEVTAPVQTNLGWYLGTVEEKKASVQRPLAKVRLEVAAQLHLKDLAKKRARAEAERALARIQQGQELMKLFPTEESSTSGFAQETKPVAQKTGEFHATSDAIPMLGSAQEAQKAIFARKDAGLLNQLVTIGDAVALIVVDERKLPSDEDFEKKKDTIKLEVLKDKQLEVSNSFLKALKELGTVVVNYDAVNQIVSGES